VEPSTTPAHSIHDALLPRQQERESTIGIDAIGQKRCAFVEAWNMSFEGSSIGDTS
jgi:hypothetical protein